MVRAAGALEILDRPVGAAARAATLSDIDRLNAWFGGYALTLREIRRVAATTAPSRPFVVLDVGGGHGAFAVRLVRWARRAGRAIRVLVVERDAESLALARHVCAAYPEIALVGADATALPFGADAAAVVATSLTLHHLEPAAAVSALRGMAAIAPHGVVINDLRRTRLALALVWLATRLLRCHPISRHDGSLSVRRAYSSRELHGLAAQAGIGNLTVREYPVFGRLVAVTR